jgi:hypothetical protein
MDANLLRTARADLFVVDWLDRWVKNGPAWSLIREVMRRRAVERRRRFGGDWRPNVQFN